MESHGRDVPMTALRGSVRDALRRSTVKIKVAVSITLGSYTIQRDAWQERTNDFLVSGDREHLILEGPPPDRVKIILSVNSLDAALAALEQVHPGGPDRVGS